MLNQGLVLLVEDDPDAVLFIKKAFAAAGITNPLRAVRDGDELIAYMKGEAPFEDRREFPLPMLLLLDLKLPRQSGFDLLEWVRKNSEVPSLIIVVLTSSSARKDIDRAYALGANSYMVKPTSFHHLVEIAGMIKSYWLTYNYFPGST